MVGQIDRRRSQRRNGSGLLPTALRSVGFDTNPRRVVGAAGRFLLLAVLRLIQLNLDRSDLIIKIPKGLGGENRSVRPACHPGAVKRGAGGDEILVLIASRASVRALLNWN